MVNELLERKTGNLEIVSERLNKNLRNEFQRLYFPASNEKLGLFIDSCNYAKTLAETAILSIIDEIAEDILLPNLFLPAYPGFKIFGDNEFYNDNEIFCSARPYFRYANIRKARSLIDFKESTLEFIFKYYGSIRDELEVFTIRESAIKKVITLYNYQINTKQIDLCDNYISILLKGTRMYDFMKVL